jgi:hypothetical protein
MGSFVCSLASISLNRCSEKQRRRIPDGNIADRLGCYCVVLEANVVHILIPNFTKVNSQIRKHLLHTESIIARATGKFCAQFRFCSIN